MPAQPAQPSSGQWYPSTTFQAPSPLHNPYAQRHPVMPFTYAVPAVVPTETPGVLEASDVVAGIRPGAYMAPNWVYPCGPTWQDQCVTDHFDPLNLGMAFSAVTRGASAVDSVTRGLLSGLQPIMPKNEVLFGPAF